MGGICLGATASVFLRFFLSKFWLSASIPPTDAYQSKQ